MKKKGPTCLSCVVQFALRHYFLLADRTIFLESSNTIMKIKKKKEKYSWYLSIKKKGPKCIWCGVQFALYHYFLLAVRMLVINEFTNAEMSLFNG